MANFFSRAASRLGAVFVQFSIVLVAVTAVLNLSEVRAADKSVPSGIMFPNIWGAELPIPDNALPNNRKGTKIGSVEVYQDETGDIQIIYVYSIKESGWKKNEYGNPYRASRKFLQGNVYSFFQQKVITRLGFEKDGNASDTYVAAHALRKIEQSYVYLRNGLKATRLSFGTTRVLVLALNVATRY